MDAIERMRSFIRVVELGSFSAAARAENVTQPTISKTVAALENHLKVRLLERTTARLKVTEEGVRFYTRSKGLVADYDEAVAEARGQLRRASGPLRISAPVGLGELRLNGLFLEFLKEYPQIDIETILVDRMVDLVEDGIDVAIRLGDNLPPDAIARRLAESPRVLVGSPGYLREAPALQRPEDVSQHAFVRYAGLASGEQLTFSKGAENIAIALHGRYRVNNSLALRQCFLQGAGLGTAPAWLVQDHIDKGDLIHLLPDWTMPSQSIHLIYPSRRQQLARTKVFLQFMTDKVPGLTGFELLSSADHGSHVTDSHPRN